MAQDINSVILVGRLTRDPELRSSSGGMSIGRMRLAVGERRKNQNSGEWEDKSNYFDVTAFGKTAEAVCSHLSKGSQLCVHGRLEWREWTTDDGDKRQAVGVVANHIQFLGSKDGDGGQRRGATGSDVPVDEQDFQPAGGDRPVTDDDILFAWRPVAWEDDHVTRFNPFV